jgi:2-hydroxychromene-2-carboxylate isomerase
VGLIAAQENWCADYSRATFHQWFIGRRAPGVADHVERVLASLGKSSAPIIARGRSAEGDHLLKEVTDDARKLGIFGAPTFAIGQEILWGDDRLAEALSFASSSAAPMR